MKASLSSSTSTIWMMTGAERCLLHRMVHGEVKAGETQSRPPAVSSVLLHELMSVHRGALRDKNPRLLGAIFLVAVMNASHNFIIKGEVWAVLSVPFDYILSC